ncbi:MAG: acyl-CoA dehydrogenase family protein [Thermoprotei archaeon]
MGGVTEKFGIEYYLQVVRERRFPLELWRDLGSHSLFGLLVDEELGGYGVSIPTFIKAIRTLSYSVGTLAYLFLAQNLVSRMVALNGVGAQLDNLLPKLIGGEARVAMGLTEESSGSDALGVTTSAQRVAGGYRIVGRKDYVTDAARVDYIIIVAKTSSNDRARSLSAFLVPTHNSGLTFTEMYKLGLDFLSLNSVTIDTIIGAQSLLGKENEAWAYLSETFALDRLALAAMLNGVSERLLEDACDYARLRVVFGKPIGANQGVQFPLARIHTELLASKALVDWVAEQYTGSQQDLTANTAAALYHSARCAYEVADEALQVKGAKGYLEGFEEACFRDIRYYRIGPLSEELSLSTIARKGLRLPS